MEGRYQVALDSARRLVKAVDAPKLATQIPLAELYNFTPIMTQLRFGKYAEVLAEPLPGKTLILDRAMSHYARAVAHANSGRLKAAKADRRALVVLQKANLARYEAAGLPVGQMLQVALASVDGEIARKSGNLQEAVQAFRRAMELERALPYTEPAYWHRPVAHLLGAALIEAGKAREAEAVYRESLTHYRRDGWALKGLMMALTAQGKIEEGASVGAAFQDAWRRADTMIEGSRL